MGGRGGGGRGAYVCERGLQLLLFEYALDKTLWPEKFFLSFFFLTISRNE